MTQHQKIHGPPGLVSNSLTAINAMCLQPRQSTLQDRPKNRLREELGKNSLVRQSVAGILALLYDEGVAHVTDRVAGKKDCNISLTFVRLIFFQLYTPDVWL